MRKARAPFAAALVLAFAAAPARADPLVNDFANMSQWLSDQMAQGLAFNAGSNFDPPKEVKGYYFQPDVSLGVGLIPFNKSTFPQLQTQALQQDGGSGLFPNSVLFPNLALHLRMGLPWRGDFYVRLADATVPPGYKISPTMTASVQTNSFGAGIRQHFFGGDWPVLTVGAHYNHVQGETKVKGNFLITAPGLSQSDAFTGDIRWDIESFGLTTIVSQSFGPWTPFAGLGFNYATGSVSASLDLAPSQINTEVYGEGSSHPERSQGREIVGVSYDWPTWSAFANGELKALGAFQYRSWIVQAGVALPFDIGRTMTVFSRKQPASPAEPKPVIDDDSAPPAVRPLSPPRVSPPPEQSPSGLIYLK